MKTLDVTFPTPEENLACDEALLRECERGACGEVLRFWEPLQHFVVLGLSNACRTETRLQEAQTRGIPVFRRCSGGGTVLQGPGCLNYALVLEIRRPGPLENITSTNRFILARHQEALKKLLGRSVDFEGSSDLALDSLKFSGNSQRRGAGWLLFHGTFLLQMDIPLIETVLQPPSRQPAYRKDRTHREFLTNLPASSTQVKQALLEAWKPDGPLNAAPEIKELIENRYSRDDWNRRI